MKACFKMYGPMGMDAPLRTGYGARKPVAGDSWKLEWEPSFERGDLNDDGDREAEDQKRDAYRALMASFADALGVVDEAGEAGGRGARLRRQANPDHASGRNSTP